MVAEFFPRSHAETSREAGKLERGQAADGGDGNHSPVEVEMLGGFPPDVAETFTQKMT